MQHFQSLTDLHRYLGLPLPEHPMMAVCWGLPEAVTGNLPFTADVYLIGLRSVFAGHVPGSDSPEERSQLWISGPESVFEGKELMAAENTFLLLFHQSYLSSTVLAGLAEFLVPTEQQNGRVLQLNAAEHLLFLDLFHLVSGEYHNNPDEFTSGIVSSHVATMLLYARRAYDRQLKEIASLKLDAINRVKK